MKTRHRALFACVAAVSLVASPGLAPTANAQDRAPTSTEIAVNSTYGLLDNPSRHRLDCLFCCRP